MSHLMVNISTLLILLACGAWFSLLLKKQHRWPAVACLILLSVIIPVAGSNTWLWINGAAGELSIVTLILLTGFILQNLTGWHLLESRTRGHLYLLVLLTGFLLFPATLGLTQFDPYSLGYTFELSLLLLSLSILYWIFQQRQLAIILLVVVAADETGVLSSNNTWDYLLDPLLWLFSPVMLIVMYAGRRKTARATV